MRTETVIHCVGENMGPIDWGHPLAVGKPQTWRAAERDPGAFLFQGRRLLAIAMYDGGPYGKPMPAIQFIGPLNRVEWMFFNSYSVCDHSIQPRVTP